MAEKKPDRREKTRQKYRDLGLTKEVLLRCSPETKQAIQAMADLVERDKAIRQALDAWSNLEYVVQTKTDGVWLDDERHGSDRAAAEHAAHEYDGRVIARYSFVL